MLSDYETTTEFNPEFRHKEINVHCCIVSAHAIQMTYLHWPELTLKPMQVGLLEVLDWCLRQCYEAINC